MENPSNLLQNFESSCRLRGRATCFRFKEGEKWVTLNWNEVYSKVLDLIGGLTKLGVKPGDRVAIFSHTCHEWTITDLAILGSGAITVPIYESTTADGTAYILQNSGAKIVFVQNAIQLEKVRSHLKNIPQLSQMIIFTDSEAANYLNQKGVYSLSQLFILGSGSPKGAPSGGENVFQTNLKTLNRNSEASFVYTSGTTGPPKGAILTHGNFLAEIHGLKSMLDFPDDIESLLFLPLAHIFARVIQFAQMELGFVQCYAESIDKLMDNVAEVKPHLMASVPRIFEKIHTRVMHGLEGESRFKKAIFNWALKIGNRRAELKLQKKSIPISLMLAWLLAYRLVFSKLHKRMGGRIDYFISGGAPFSKDIGDFFQAAGFTILEGYGLTETTAAVTVNTKKEPKVGTVGKVLPGVEIKIASDGEILVRGPVVFKGYHQLPEDTKNALTSDGWFHTGDIGEFDSDGFLKITDRKKDIIVTAAGKNVAPQNIESLIKTDPMISQVMVHGDKRKFLSALVTLNKDQLIHYAKSHNIFFQNYSDLVKNQEVYLLVKGRIEEKNKQLAKYETIKKFAILENDFSVETGELTPTLKVKRKFTSEKYKNLIDQFYQE